MLEADIHKALRDFPLDLKIDASPGKIVVLMGENGAGKSTVLNIISGLLAPDAGSIQLNGRTLYRSSSGISVPVESRCIGYVLQHSAVFPHLSVSDNIAFGMKALRKPKDHISHQVERWMRLLDIGDHASIKAKYLSGGQKQRVAIARALAIEPDLLMLDEPFTALDRESRRNVQDVVRSYVSDLNIPCLIVTHRFSDTHGMGDRVYLMRRGTRQWEGPPGNLSDAIMQPQVTETRVLPEG